MTNQFDKNANSRVDNRLRNTTNDYSSFNPDINNASGRKKGFSPTGSSDKDSDEDKDQFEDRFAMAEERHKKATMSSSNDKDDFSGRSSEMRRTGVHIKGNPMKSMSQSTDNVKDQKKPIQVIKEEEENKEAGKHEDDDDLDFDPFANFEKNIRSTEVIQNNLHEKRATAITEKEFAPTKRETINKVNVRKSGDEQQKTMSLPVEKPIVLDKPVVIQQETVIQQSKPTFQMQDKPVIIPPVSQQKEVVKPQLSQSTNQVPTFQQQAKFPVQQQVRQEERKVETTSLSGTFDQQRQQKEIAKQQQQQPEEKKIDKPPVQIIKQEDKKVEDDGMKSIAANIKKLSDMGRSKEIQQKQQQEEKKNYPNGGYQPQNARDRSPMNINANNFNKKMVTDMYSAVYEEEDPKYKEDELSDKEDIEYRNYALQSKLDEQDILTEKEKQKEQQKILDLANKENSVILSDSDDFINDHYQVMHLDTLAENSQSPHFKRKATRLMQKQSQEEWSKKEVINMIDWNERRHQEVAREQLNQNSVISLKKVQVQKVQLRLLSEFTIMQKVTNMLIAEKQYHNAKATCVSVSEDLIFLGNSEGQLMMFDRETEEHYYTFTEKSKEFLGNTITAVDSHPTRIDYVVLGFEKGQLVLFDVTDPKKSLKIIKDHHKGVPISNVKFCDWKGKTKQQKESEVPQSGANSQEDKQIWMFVSIDADGKVIVNTVKKVVFMFNVTKHVIIDPNKVNAPLFSSIAARFEQDYFKLELTYRDPMYASFDQQLDGALIALGNTETVYILKIRPNYHGELFRIDRPQKYFSKKESRQKDFKARLPSLSWGYGHTPVFKDKGYSILAIGWGPLIQLVTVNDLRSRDQAFVLEGHYLLRPNKEDQEYKMLKYERRGDKKQNIKQIMKLEKDEDDDDEKYLNNESIIYQINSINIEQICFLSESTLLVLTSGLEIRILYTELFYPDKYQASINSSKRPVLLDKDGNKRDPVLDKEIFLSAVANSEHGSTYHQTIKLSNGLVVVISEKGLYKSFQFTWVQSLIEFKRIVKGDWIQVFAKALEFYKGKIKGFLGVHEDENVREGAMKAELKLLIRDIIQEMVAKWNVLSSRTNQNAIATMGAAMPQQRYNLDESSIDINEHLKLIDSLEDRKVENYQTLIRIAIEFCVELKDCYFLFYDLFLMFQEEKMEKQFIQELEPFIIAGRFTEWELPVDILQNHIINFYKDHSHPENLEKVIINLNLASCPKLVISELIEFSQKHFLSTAILFLTTQVFERKDNSSCIQVLFSLYDLYKKAGKVNKGSFEKIQGMKDHNPESYEHKQVEKSQCYLGYKILWIIRLFLGGKKFPNGNIRESKWRMYIHDIVQFISTKEILNSLLEIDAEAFFQIISILFFEGRPCDLMKMGRDKALVGNEDSVSHLDLLNILQEVCINKQPPVTSTNSFKHDYKMQFLFFAGNVAAKCQNIHQDKKYYYNIVKELLRNNKRYLEFNDHLLRRGVDKGGLMKQLSFKMAQKINDNLKHVLKSEDDLIALMKQCEPLSSDQIVDLQKVSDHTQFGQVKIYLLEKQEEYLKCLQLFLEGMKVSEVYSSKESKKRVFLWIRDKLKFLQEKSSKSAKDEKIFETFKEQITRNLKQMIDLEPEHTVLLIDEEFTTNHKKMIDQLFQYPLEQLQYLEALLKVKEKLISDTIREYHLSSANPQEAKKYWDFMKQHLRLCCQLKSSTVITIIEQIATQSYYPTDDCLKICQEFKQIEACALLNKKLKNYYDSVQGYLMVMKQKVNLKMLKYELHEAKIRGWNTNYPITNEKLMPNCTKVDHMVKKVTNICKKNSKEVDIGKEELIWYDVLDTLFELKQNQQLIQKSFCREYFEKRINLFVIELVNYIPFQNFIEKFAATQKEVKFSDLKGVLFDIFSDFKSEKIILKDVKSSIFLMASDNFRQYNMISGRGVLFRSLKCLLCKRYLDGSLFESYTQIEVDDNDEQGYNTYDQSNDLIRVFACKHSFHDRCVNKFYLNRVNLYDEKISDRQQCPECNKKNFDIDYEMNSRSANRSGKMGKEKSTDGRTESSSSRDASEGKRNLVSRNNEAMIKKQMNKLNKRMEAFDNNFELDCVTTKNFKR